MSTNKRANGHVQQTQLKRKLTHNASYNFNTLIEGVVVGIHYPEEDSNRSKTTIEYDVDPTSVFGMGRIYNACRADIMAGIDDGEDNVLRKADGTSSGSGTYNSDTSPAGGESSAATPRYQTTGDRVLVGFINGNVYRPVIVGVLPHKNPRMRKSGEALKDINGDALPGSGKLFRRTQHKGTEMVVDDKGNVTVTFAKGKDDTGQETDDKKKLKIVIGDFEITIDNSSSPSTTTFAIKGGGPILSFTKEAFKLGGADEPGVLGNTLKNILGDFLDDYGSHQHTGNYGAPTPLMPPSVAKAPALKAQLDNALSDWVKLSKAKPS